MARSGSLNLSNDFSHSRRDSSFSAVDTDGLFTVGYSDWGVELTTDISLVLT